MNNESEPINGEKRDFIINQSDFPEILILSKGKGISISKAKLSPKAMLSLRKLASYANPEFYKKQAMRQSTYDTPRVTVLYEEDNESIILPRDIESKLKSILEKADVKYVVEDHRYEGQALDINFSGQLMSRQNEAFKELSRFDDGVLSATAGFGKTVTGARLIAEKKRSTLILVHTRELAIQWKERLEQFLEINEVIEKPRKNESIIGQLGGGKNTVHGLVIVESNDSKNISESDDFAENINHINNDYVQ